MNIASGDPYGLLLQSNALRPMIVGIEGYDQGPLLASLECLSPLGVIVKHVKRRALPLGHHQGGRGARSGSPDATDVNGRIPLNVHHEARVHFSTEPHYGAEIVEAGLTRSNDSVPALVAVPPMRMSPVMRPKSMRHPDPSARSFPRVTYMMEALLSRPNDLCDPDVVDVGFDPLSSRAAYSI